MVLKKTENEIGKLADVSLNEYKHLGVTLNEKGCESVENCMQGKSMVWKAYKCDT